MRKAVVSMAFGNDWWKIASVSFQALSLYAEKIGADFVVMSKRRYPNLHVLSKVWSDTTQDFSAWNALQPQSAGRRPVAPRPGPPTPSSA